LKAVEYLRQINESRQRVLGSDTPTAFVPPRWKQLVFTDDGSLDRHYWELCVLADLRTSLTSIANVQRVMPKRSTVCAACHGPRVCPLTTMPQVCLE